MHGLQQADLVPKTTIVKSEMQCRVDMGRLDKLVSNDVQTNRIRCAIGRLVVVLEK